MSVAAGQIVTEEDLTAFTTRVIARGNRTAATAGFSTVETGILRVDNVSCIGGRAYRVSASGISIGLSGTTSGMLLRLRRSTSGAASTSSTEIGAWRTQPTSNAAIDPITSFETWYFPTSDETASFLLTAIREGGADVTLGISAATGGINLIVADCGVAPADTGVDI